MFDLLLIVCLFLVFGTTKKLRFMTKNLFVLFVCVIFLGICWVFLGGRINGDDYGNIMYINDNGASQMRKKKLYK